MKKTLLASGLALAMGTGVAQAAFLAPGSTGTINFTSGCFDFGTCVIGGAGNIPDNALTAGGLTPGIAGDGLVGFLTFTVGGDGNSFTVNSYSQDSYTGTAGGTFAIDAPSVAGMSGFISDSGDVTLDTSGRIGAAAYFGYLGTPAWNIDNSTTIGGQGDPTTGVQSLLTTGSQSGWTPGVPGTPTNTITGSALTNTGVGTWTGLIISSDNIGSGWGGFDSTPYTEQFNMTVLGTAAPAVPVPAAVWLFGSGLLGLVGVARRKKTMS